MKAGGNLLLAFILTGTTTSAQDPVYQYWVQFTDKNGSPYSVEQPEAFLSPGAIERRKRFQIPVRWNDLPVNPAYPDSLRSDSVKVLYTSKWFNGAVIQASDTARAKKVLSRPFVDHIKILYQPSCAVKSTHDKFIRWEAEDGEILFSDHQIKMLQGHFLHDEGYYGKGKIIAVLDSGFEGADTIAGLDSVRIKNRIIGTRSYVNPAGDVYSLGDHGTRVLSIMAGNIPGSYLGTSPEASFLLVQTEDVRTEFHIEEANWLAGAEFADSMGADIINTSLGYSDGFTCPSENYTYPDMDGNTALITRAADLAASKGILVIASAGNSGKPTDPWQFIGAPADGDSVLAVGAVDSSGLPADFSSRGPAFDGRPKPDVCAMGVSVAAIRASGSIEPGSGTSFASPVIAGLSACLWQKHPEISGYELMEVIRKSCDLYPFYDEKQGFGKPDFMRASGQIAGQASMPEENKKLHVFPNPAGNSLCLFVPSLAKIPATFRIIDLRGRNLISGNVPVQEHMAVIPLTGITPGTYLIILDDGQELYNAIFTKE